MKGWVADEPDWHEHAANEKEKEMKRSLVLLMILGLVVGSVAMAGAKKKSRRVERTVEAGYATQFVLDDPYCWQPGGSCVRIEPRKGETFFTATAVDAHGQPVFVTA